MAVHILGQKKRQEVDFNISCRSKPGRVLIEFSQSIRAISLNSKMAVNLAEAIMKEAQKSITLLKSPGNGDKGKPG